MADIDLFGQTYTAILQKIMGGGNPNFQLIYPFADWWWPTAPARQISPQAYNFVSQVPQWSTVGRYNPAGTNLLDAYREVLYQVNLSVPPAKQQQVKDATDQRMIAHNQWGSDYAAMITAWDTMLANTPSTFPAPDFGKWQTDSGWTATLAVDTADVTKTDETLANIIAQENPEYTTALEAIKAPADIHTSKAGWMLTDQGGGNLVSVPSWTIEDSGPDWVARLTKGGSPITINLDSSVSSSALSESWAEGSGSEGWYFFEIEASGSWHKLDLTESSQEVKVSVTLQAAAVVGVTPGSWYNGGYLRKLALDPHAFTTPYAPSGGESPVFGEGGLLPLSVVGLVVGYQPSFRIEMDQAAYDHHLQEFSGSGGIRIGPFVFGGSGRHVTDNWTKTHDNRVYEGTSTATYPVLLGVIVTRPGLD